MALCGQNSFSIQKRKLYHFASKHAFDMEGLGPKIIDVLFGAKLITTFEDIFTLKRGDLLELPRFAEKSVDNLLASIEKRAPFRSQNSSLVFLSRKSGKKPPMTSPLISSRWKDFGKQPLRNWSISAESALLSGRLS